QKYHVNPKIINKKINLNNLSQNHQKDFMEEINFDPKNIMFIGQEAFTEVSFEIFRQYAVETPISEIVKSVTKAKKVNEDRDIGNLRGCRH
ncbi:MAG: hypothetical protein Q8807_03115, partial ['Waltheria sp.' little leaf phytoplasma]|nr:hypothetical protein ['Waltheria sp.' little leaf phytoplasma]